MLGSITEHEIGLFKLTSTELLSHLRERLTERGWKVRAGREFVYSTGKLPVLLVAHVDTVHDQPPEKIFYDATAGVLWSPDGLGADDRAGIIGILRLLDRGYAPHVLFTDGEEYGGTGATEAVRELCDPGVRFVVELDRMNSIEAVFYGCQNTDFKKYITGFGYTEARGSFSDISIICPDWNVAGVNLSCGYHNAHSRIEYLSLPELEGSLSMVEKILQNIPRKRFRYQERSNILDHLRRPKSTTKKQAKVYELYEETRTTTYSSTYETEEYLYEEAGLQHICVMVDPEYLADLFGGTPLLWARWFQNNEDLLTNLVDQVVHDAAQQDADDGVLDVLYYYT